MLRSLEDGEKWSEWNEIRQAAAHLRLFGLTTTLAGQIVAMALWRPDRRTARVVHTWANAKIPRLMESLLEVLPNTVPTQFNSVVACINEDCVELCNDFKRAGYRSVKVLPRLFEGRDGILFAKIREANSGGISDQDLGQGDGKV